MKTNKIIYTLIFFLLFFSIAKELRAQEQTILDKATKINATSHNEIKKILTQLEAQTPVKYIPRYEQGQGSVSLGAGVIFPLFFQKYTGEYTDARLSLGGHLWFEWDLYIWKGLSAGMEIAGMFAQTANSRTLFMAPITTHVKYTFQIFPVEFPVSLAFGMNMGSLEELFKVDFILKPKIGSSYRINQNWTIGMFTSYWFIVQDYNNTNLDSKYSRLGNFIDTTLGFSYVF